MLHSPPFVKLPFGKQKGNRILDEVQNAGAIESDAEEGIDCRQHQGDEDAGLGERQDREQKAHTDDTHVPEFPEPQGCFGGQVIGIDVQIVHLQEKSRRVFPAASSVDYASVVGWVRLCASYSASACSMSPMTNSFWLIFLPRCFSAAMKFFSRRSSSSGI